MGAGDCLKDIVLFGVEIGFEAGLDGLWSLQCSRPCPALLAVPVALKPYGVPYGFRGNSREPAPRSAAETGRCHLASHAPWWCIALFPSTAPVKPPRTLWPHRGAKGSVLAALGAEERSEELPQIRFYRPA